MQAFHPAGLPLVATGGVSNCAASPCVYFTTCTGRPLCEDLEIGSSYEPFTYDRGTLRIYNSPLLMEIIFPGKINHCSVAAKFIRQECCPSVGLFQSLCPIFQAPHGLHFRLGEDTLMSHSAPALMRRNADNPKDIYEEKGTVIIWHWLSLNRFFPPNMKYQRILRGCASVSLQTLESDHCQILVIMMVF